MALNGIFATPPSGASEPTGTFGKARLKGTFAAPPPEIDTGFAQRQAMEAQAAHDAQVSAESSKYANSFGGIVKTAGNEAVAPFVQGYKDAAAAVKPKSWNPLEIAKNGAQAVEEAFGSSLDDTGEKLYKAATIIGQHPLSTEAFASGGEAALGAVNTLFAAATAPLIYATAIPGIGQVADKVNEVFSALASGAGAHVATAYVDDNPYLSQETKDTIRPLVHDSAGLIAQLVAGKAGSVGFEKLGGHTKAILGAVSKDVKTNPPSANPKFNVAPLDGTLNERLDATAPRQLPVYGDTSLRRIPITDENAPGVQTIPNNAFYPAPESLPTIPLGRVPSGDLPTIQAGKTPTGQIPGLSYEPIKPVASDVAPAPVPDFTQPPKLFHGADTETAAKIRSGGFRGSEDFPGNGMVSLTPDVTEAGNYAKLGKSGQGEVLPVEITGDKTKVYDSMKEYEDALEKAPGKTAGEKERALNQPYDVVRIKEEGQQDIVFAKPEAVKVADVSRETAAAPELPEVPRATSDDRGIPKLSSNVEAKAIAQNLAEEFGDLPQYDKVNWADQAAKAQKLLTEEPGRAHRIALGQELPPDGLLHGAVFDAVERQAFKNGDIQTILRLSRDSTLGAKASRYGQEIGVLAMRDTGSPVKTIDSIKKSREASFEKKTGKKAATEAKKTVNEIKSEIKETAKASRPSWEEFMSDLTCNI